MALECIYSYMERFDHTALAARIAGECPAIRVREASRLLTRIYDAALQPLRLQNTQLAVLVTVAMFGERGALIGPLARRLAMDRTTLTRNLKPLEKAALIRVSPSPTDARARVVTLTPAGERMIEAAYPLWEQAQQRVRESVGSERIDALRSNLTEMMVRAPRLDGGAG
jgi:DNA-binding MarR family transcriptional regulator